MFKSSIDLGMIDVTSKMSLKISCLRACENKVDKAKELYDFITEGIESIPDFDPEKPGTFEKIKTGASDLFGWINAHQDELTKGMMMLQSLKKPK